MKQKNRGRGRKPRRRKGRSCEGRQHQHPLTPGLWAGGQRAESRDALTEERARRQATRETVTRSRAGVGQLDTQMYSERASFPRSHIHYASPSGGDPKATATAWTPSSGESEVRGAGRSGTERTLGF